MNSLKLLCVSAVLLGSTGCFPHEPGRRLAHFADRSPAAGEMAPSFALQDLDGEVIELADLFGERPVVVQLGSRSCPVFRYRRFGMESLIEEFAGRADFVVVYTVEAHPEGAKSPYDDEEWLTIINRLTGVRIEQPETVDARRAEAAETAARFGLSQRVLVDTIGNEAWEAYGSAPSAAFVVDRSGEVALRQVWVDPTEIRATLEELLSPSRSGS